ncbi:MAG: hypothetical protein KQJ78_02675 [Deltaproteobacteria bacterium]|nr:hypothetical protein [Deltaproteobacteria bacterium]
MTLRRVIATLACLAGLGASVVLFLGAGEPGTWACPRGDCLEVLRSPLASFLGIELSRWGVFYWGVSLLLVLAAPRSGLTAFLAAAGGVFSLGLLWSQYQGPAFCLWCGVSGLAAVVFALCALAPLAAPRSGTL